MLTNRQTNTQTDTILKTVPPCDAIAAWVVIRGSWLILFHHVIDDKTVVEFKFR